MKLSYLKQLDEQSRRWIRTTVWLHKVPDHCESHLSGITSYLWSTQTEGLLPAVVNRFRQSVHKANKHMHEHKHASIHHGFFQQDALWSLGVGCKNHCSGCRVHWQTEFFPSTHHLDFFSFNCRRGKESQHIQKTCSVGGKEYVGDTWWNVVLDSPGMTQPVGQAD